DERLGTHFESRRHEEQGHDTWAEQDLEKVAPKAPPAGVLPSMVALVGWNARQIDADPTVYLAYILLAEYLTVIIGPQWLRVLADHCRIQPEATSVVANHVERDRGPVESALEEPDDLVADPRRLAPMRDMLRASVALF